MKKIVFGLALGAATLVSTSLWAGEKTIKLSVPGMTCASCPFIVKQAVSDVDGVTHVIATMEDLSATVTFDDNQTSLELIQEATNNVGYASSLFVEPSES